MSETLHSFVRLKLCEALSCEPAVITRFANHLHDKNLITEATRGDVVGTQGVKPYDQATKLADPVIVRLNDPQNAPNNWDKLLQALWCCGLGDLAENLELEKRGRSGVNSRDDSSAISPLDLTQNETDGSHIEGASPHSKLPFTPLSSTPISSQTRKAPEQLWSPTQQSLSSSKDLNATGSLPLVRLNFKHPIRRYQEELATPGINGENYIICAPTGSGKTLVAAMVIADHLQKHRKDGEQTGKVVFLVKTQQLAWQQRQKLAESIEGARVVEVTGGDVSIATLIPKVDIIVCTDGKLLNELKSKSVTISRFTLFMVDECHHCIGGDYANIMEYHLLQKLKDDSQKTPQVVGLTASPGAGKGKSPTLIKAINHQLLLCARLDAASGIKVVTENTEELDQFCNKPEHELTILEQRSPLERFHEHISIAMKTLEGILGDGPPYNRSSFQYYWWVEKEKEAAELQAENRERDRISILEHLALYVQALLTFEDFSSEDALSVLREISPFPEETATRIERKLNGILTNLLSVLSQLECNANPLLEEAEKILVQQFKKNPEAKVIFFVCAIKHTQYVCRWVQQSKELSKYIRPESITGHTRAGMTKEQQATVVEGFKSGKYNLLASTTVLEEGLDVAACNLVIRFQTMSNEIAQVQAQGRARAKESKMYTIISSQSEKQCQQLINEEKKALALQAIQFIPHMLTSLRSTQKGILEKREIREKTAAERKQFWKPEEVDVLCKKCATRACTAADINTYHKHYIVRHKSFQRMIQCRPHDKPPIPGEMRRPYKIFCAECSADWGVWGWWNSVCLEFPVLRCAGFIFRHKSGNRLSIKQWGKVPFEVHPLPDNYQPDD